ncbi:methionyl-tRNA formyltransferase [Alphaproteobacteria bacterium endosymbiont of Tiliacea citrago]|uniref:methionyl-tRNA formyltransferase n=1 Tax=Alphaproteobacteria bacterium endosymbiont of Tiliacea citrago TaxID=3077944 RepID=UPI00313BD642
MINIVLIGTPKFVIPFFEEILNDKNFNIVSIITRAAKEKLKVSDISIWGKKKQLKVIESKNFNKDQEVMEVLQKADVALVFAFGKIISKNMLSLPKNGFLNIHPSKLPDLRGPSPLQTAILKGYKTSALTLMKMNEKMDEGDIISQKEFNINNNHNINVVMQKLGFWGPKWISEEIMKFLKNPILKKQDETKATYCYLTKNEDYFITNENADEILRKIRALGYVFLSVNGINIKCFLAKKETSDFMLNQVSPVFLQFPGKKIMHVRNFLNGYKNKLTS